MKLYYFPGSTTCRPVQMFAAEAGVPLALETVDLMSGAHLTAAFGAINANRCVPVLEEPDGFRLAESSAILKYLAEKAGSPAYPSDPRGRARVNAQMDWFNTGFYREFGYGFVYPQILPHLGWKGPAVQAAVLARGAERSAQLMGVLNDHWLGGDGPYLGGADPDLADYLGVCFASIGEMIAFDFAPYPRITRWMEAMRARPCWAEVNGPWEAWRDHCLAQRTAKA
ncbi:glutathione S-transferase [Caldovatus sediminis]|uniref:Glutathione S-transferase n=1 Tax=Caldovatus sediminis TaxID=2041189 RepID=A0A8J2ZEE5_9PROT|nr:glutathione S-transferase family protein [Caldovatus sediminis]GGG46656.1 glutathione S-transferase [Caldovatus sediminis]